MSMKWSGPHHNNFGFGANRNLFRGVDRVEITCYAVSVKWTGTDHDNFGLWAHKNLLLDRFIRLKLRVMRSLCNGQILIMIILNYRQTEVCC